MMTQGTVGTYTQASGSAANCHFEDFPTQQTEYTEVDDKSAKSRYSNKHSRRTSSVATMSQKSIVESMTQSIKASVKRNKGVRIPSERYLTLRIEFSESLSSSDGFLVVLGGPLEGGGFLVLGLSLGVETGDSFLGLATGDGEQCSPSVDLGLILFFPQSLSLPMIWMHCSSMVSSSGRSSRVTGWVRLFSTHQRKIRSWRVSVSTCVG